MNSGDRKNLPTATSDADVEQKVFTAARKLSGDTQTDYLHQTCGDDQNLLRRIENLLQAASADSGLLDRDFKSVYFELSDLEGLKAGDTKSVVDGDARKLLLDVTNRHKELDSEFNIASCRYEIVGGCVTELEIPLARDHSPLQSLIDLKKLRIINPLGRKDRVDLSFAKEMNQLHTLKLGHVRFDNLKALRGLPIEKLDVWNCNAATKPNGRQEIDLSPLKGMPLRWLNCGGHNIENIESLSGMELESVNINFTNVSDLSVFNGMPLRTLQMNSVPATDLSPLKGSQLKTLEISHSGVTDLTPLVGMELEHLHMLGLENANFSVLMDCDIRALWLDHNESYEEIVKSIRGLQRLNGGSLEKFLKPHSHSDAG